MSVKSAQKVSNPRVTVVTVNYNNSAGLEKTINSVINQTYDNYQYLIVDGGSTDGSVSVIDSFHPAEIDAVAEKDEGIYHAMNKAIAIAEGEWLLFMNSGDEFVDSTSLNFAMSKRTPTTDVIYANWIYANSGKHINASKERMAVIHQSVIYKKSLHDVYGTYVTSNNVTISDYIFFLSIAGTEWNYHDAPLSICDESGVSSKISHFYQKVSIDFIFERKSKIMLLIILIFYPSYKFFKNLIVGLKIH